MRPANETPVYCVKGPIAFVSSVARGGAMGHLHPPNLNYYALDIIEFWPLIYKNLKFVGLFGQNCPIAPPNKISGYATGYLS